MFEFNFNNNKYKHIHFIGIGGVSMSGMAEILLSKDYKVTGTDANKSNITRHLEGLGAKIYYGHNEDNLKGADLIIYTDAISDSNPELYQAKLSMVPTIDRATFLGAIMKNYKNSIAVSGTHGKTTTTSILASVTNHIEDFNPTILLGGQLDEIGGNLRLASEDCIITEACEYKGNILKYFPTTAIILNIDEDHLDYFSNLQHIISTFAGYARNIQEGGNLIVNKDDKNICDVVKSTKANIISFGIDEKADYQAVNIRYADSYTEFDLLYKNKKYPMKINVIGKHNIYNALAAIVALHVHNISIETIQEYLPVYHGVHRRLEFKGEYNGAYILDDYAHHPTEIQATLHAIKKSNNNKGKIYCVFQPHTFTRTQILLNSFSESFKNVDEVIITDIFAAREKNNGTVHSMDLAEAVNLKSNNAKYIGSFDEVENYLIDQVEPEDLIITMGAGNVYLIGEALLGLEDSRHLKSINI